MKHICRILVLTLWLGVSLSYASSNATQQPAYQSNFYDAVNHDWIVSHHIPADKNEVGSYTNLDDEMLVRFKELIQTLQNAKKRTPQEQKIVDFYTSYSDMDMRNKQGISPLQKDLDAIKQVKNKKELAHLIANMPKIWIVGEPIPFDFKVKVSDSNASQYMIVGMQNRRPALPNHFYLDNTKTAKTKIDHYRTYVSDLLKLADYNDTDKMVNNTIALEAKLASARWSRADGRDAQKTHNPMSFDELNRLLSHLDMPYFFKVKGYKRDANINIKQPSFFKALNLLLETEPLQVWQDCLTVHLLENSVNVLSEDFIKAKHRYDVSNDLSGEIEPLEITATRMTSYFLDQLFGKVYIDHYFDERSKVAVEKMLHNIVERYKEAFEKTDLFGKETKKAALEKLAKMRFNVAYPNKWRDYSALKVVPHDLIANLKEIKRFLLAIEVQKLERGTIDRDEWTMTPQDVNSYYDDHLNKFNLLAGMLNPPFFDLNASDAANYAGIGRTIAHEIGHGFDSNGAKFDGDGNLHNWWSQEDHEKFEHIVKALIDQANNYELFPGIHANGEMEIGEIMADLSGTEIVLAAFLKTLKGDEREIRRQTKAFFIALARSLRSKTRKELIIQRNDTDEHPLDAYRINGTVRNIDAFYDVFDIKEGDAMYLPPGINGYIFGSNELHKGTKTWTSKPIRQ